ncbi:hypothetical protein CLG94_03295 [Candidatus Methylomirabilis limnetica]|uniref:Uncharacterized protein n=1 Tax=Candidatus Methylomirabilis limnetica TaxID=2033718 RepID=A0A2T4U011_9BACT|nr:hypothetical protein CLG94_03295 [Candidatus Methylomirabilis limnetica]
MPYCLLVIPVVRRMIGGSLSRGVRKLVEEMEKDRDLLKSVQVLCETMRRGRPFKKTIRQA